MSVKLSRYVFRKIGGRIIPIRKGIELASKSKNKLAKLVSKHHEAGSKLRWLKQVSPRRKFVTESSIAKKLQSKVLKEGLEKVGSGVDLTVFKRKQSNDFVLKTLKEVGGRTTSGTASKSLIRKFPELADKIALNKVAGANLPNFGIPTHESEIVRIKGSFRGLFQKYIPKKELNRDFNKKWIHKEADSILKKHGLSLDVHASNIDKHGTLIDTGLNLKKSGLKIDDTAKEIIGIDNYYGANIKDYFKKSDLLSDEAAIYGQSQSAIKRIKKLMKQGYGYKRTGSNEYKLVLKKIKNNK